MKASKAQKDGLMEMLGTLYARIRPLEDAYNIRVDEKDLRPRIEYFHDAVRAYASGEDKAHRLSIEFLAYDLGLLRHIQARPLPVKHHTPASNPTKELITPGSFPAPFSFTIAEVRQQLSEQYGHYSVLYAALLTEHADRDYYSKIGQHNQEVEDIETAIAQLPAHADTSVNLEALAEHYGIDSAPLHAALNGQRSTTSQQAKRLLSELSKATDAHITRIEKAHFTFATTRLALYEQARDVVKTMAQQGMNLVGQFVEDAVREARGGARSR